MPVLRGQREGRCVLVYNYRRLASNIIEPWFDDFTRSTLSSMLTTTNLTKSPFTPEARLYAIQSLVQTSMEIHLAINVGVELKATTDAALKHLTEAQVHRSMLVEGA